MLYHHVEYVYSYIRLYLPLKLLGFRRWRLKLGVVVTSNVNGRLIEFVVFFSRQAICVTLHYLESTERVRYTGLPCK
jgi:hypothetical protein